MVTIAWNVSPLATIVRPCFRMKLDLLDSSANGVAIRDRSSSDIWSRSSSRSDRRSSSMFRNAYSRYQLHANLRTILLKKFTHSSRVGGLLLAFLEPRLSLLSVVNACRRRLREAEGLRGLPSASLSFPAPNSASIVSPDDMTVLSVIVCAVYDSSAGNGSLSINSPSAMSSSLSSASELMTIRGSFGSSPRLSAASGVIPLPGIG